ncbi:MAG: sulfotransferase [Myxococcota bacterium]|nr:sulfotransferase [Myxococcota bacterium]
MIYIVLGMHKSGTTLVSQTLHHSGINMGEDFDQSVGYKNNKYEWRDPFLINLELLEADEETYFSLNCHQAFREPTPAPIKKRIRDLATDAETRNTDWGFKDPLTCLTYASWAENLTPHKVIGVYRSPSQVLKHYHANWKRPYLGYRALRAWSSYNQAMLSAVRARPNDSILVRYEELMSGSSEFERLQAFCGRTLDDRRRSSEYHTRKESPLFRPLDIPMALGATPQPSRTLRELEAFRASQLEHPHSETE